jgi:hypothetical protein
MQTADKGRTIKPNLGRRGNALERIATDKYTSITRAWAVLAMTLLVLGFAALAARGLTARAMWNDERWSLYSAGGAPYGPLTVTQMFERMIVEEPWTMPAHYLSLNGWAWVAGWSPLAGRALSWLVGALAVAWVYRLGADVARDRLVGVLSALTLATSAFFLHYAAELRNYALHPLAVAMAAALYWRVLCRLQRGQRLSLGLMAALVFSVGLLPYVHYFAVLSALALGVFHVGYCVQQRAAWRVWWQPLALMALAAALFAPWALLVMFPVLGRVQATGHDTPTLGWADLPQTVLAFANASLPLAVLALYGFVRAWQSHTQRAGLLMIVCGAAGMLLLAYALNTWRPILLYHRYLIGVFPFLAVLAGVGLAALIAQWRGGVVVAAAWLLLGVATAFTPAFMDAYQNPLLKMHDWHRLAPLLVRYATPADALVMHPPNGVWFMWQLVGAEYYLHGSAFDCGVPAAEQAARTGAYTANCAILDSFPADVSDVAYYARAERVLAAAAPQVWSVTVALPTQRAINVQASGRADALPLFEQALSNNGYADCGLTLSTGDLRARLYARADQAPTATFAAADGGTLAIRAPLPLVYDDTVHVPLVVTAQGLDPNAYSISVQAWPLDSDQPIAQTDRGIPTASAPCADYALTDVPTGVYRVVLIAYRWQDGTRLRTPDGTAYQVLGTIGD